MLRLQPGLPKSSVPFGRRAESRVMRRGKRAVATRVRAAAAPQKTADRFLLDYETYLVPVYAPPDVVLVSGNGTRAVDSEGKSYLDFSTGIAVNALGHADDRIVSALTDQARRIMHTSNLLHSQPGVELAKNLVQNSFADKVFFCNSGTEATEAAIKFARKWAAVLHGVDPYDPHTVGPHEIVSFTSAFHGRTLAALSITPKSKIRSPFLPLVPGHKLATFNDLTSAEDVIESGKTCAVFVEPVQGEGGVNVATKAFLQGLRELCDERKCLLVFDEVQCGLGRTGKLWAHLHYDVTPDIMTLAKPLAGGLPMGAVLVKQHVAGAMEVGDHGSTFAGNPLVCHVANTVLDIIKEPEFLDHVAESGRYFAAELENALAEFSRVKEIRSRGLFVGVECDGPVGDVVTAAREKGLIVLTAGGGDVVRLAPPLNVAKADLDEAVAILKEAFRLAA